MRGVVLVLIISLLFLLSGMAFYFLLSSRTERTASHEVIRRIQARFAASSGVEYAFVHLPQSLLSGDLSSPTAPWVFAGEDTHHNGRLDPGEDLNRDGFLNILSFPLREARRPSYAHELAPGQNSTSSSPQWVTGFLTKGEEDLTFSLRINDENSRLYINGGNLTDPSDPSNKPTERILDCLGQNFLNLPSLGTQIIQHRPPKGYSSLKELASFLSPSEMDKVQEFVSLYSYVDPKVVRPNGLAYRRVNPAPEGPSLLKVGDAVLEWKQLEPVEFTLEPRSPVNINQARPELLTCLISDLQGFYLDFPPSSPSPPAAPPQEPQQPEKQKGWPKPAPIGVVHLTPPISFSQAQQITEAILLRRQKLPFTGFSGLQGFHAFCNSLVQQGILDANQADVLKANFTPDTDIQFYNPNALMYKSVDKLALTTYSTEFSFYPMGYFWIDSLGQVWQGEHLTAEAELHTDVKLFDVWNDTTQHDFFGDSFSSFARQISASHDVPTRLDASLDSYPIPATPFTAPSRLDGQIALDTIEDQVEKQNPKVGTLLGRASFSTLLDADYGDLGLAQPHICYAFPPFSIIEYPRLFPDGAYSEIFNPLYYNLQQLLDSVSRRHLQQLRERLLAQLRETEDKALEGDSAKQEQYTKEVSQLRAELQSIPQPREIPTAWAKNRAQVLGEVEKSRSPGVQKSGNPTPPALKRETLLRVINLIPPESIQTLQGNQKYTAKDVAEAQAILAILFRLVSTHLQWFVQFVPKQSPGEETGQEASSPPSSLSFPRRRKSSLQKSEEEGKKLGRQRGGVSGQRTATSEYETKDKKQGAGNHQKEEKKNPPPAVISFITPLELLLSPPFREILPLPFQTWIRQLSTLANQQQFFHAQGRGNPSSPATGEDTRFAQHFLETVEKTFLPETLNSLPACAAQELLQATASPPPEHLLTTYHFASPESLTANSVTTPERAEEWEKGRKKEEEEEAQRNCPPPLGFAGKVVTWEPNFCPGIKYPVSTDALVHFFKSLKFTDYSVAFGSGLESLQGEDTQKEILHLLQGQKVVGFPHSACFWDILSEQGGIHFFPPEFTPETIKEAFSQQPDVETMMLHQWEESMTCWFHSNVSFWFKSNDLTQPMSAGKVSPKEHILFSLSRGSPYFPNGPPLQQFFLVLEPALSGTTLGGQTLHWRINDGFQSDPGEQKLFRETAWAPKDISGFAPLPLLPHQWNHLVLFFDRSQAKKAGKVSIGQALSGQLGIGTQFLLFLNGKLMGGTQATAVFNRLQSSLSGDSPGIRFGELFNRGFGNLQDTNDPWALGYSGADTTYDEILMFNDLTPQALHTLPQELYNQGRYYDRPPLTFASQPRCFITPHRLLRVLTTFWTPPNSPFTLDFRLRSQPPPNYSPNPDFSFQIGSSADSTHRLSLLTFPLTLYGTTRYELEMRPNSEASTGSNEHTPLLETPFIDSITLLYQSAQPVIFQYLYK